MDGLLVELRDEFGEGVELGIGKETDEVGGVSRPDMVALKVKGDVFEGDGVAVDVESADGRGGVLAGVGCLFELAKEVLREVGGGCPMCQLRVRCENEGEVTHRRRILMLQIA